jgi:multiple sugar transport system substrate-binding protein
MVNKRELATAAACLCTAFLASCAQSVMETAITSSTQRSTPTPVAATPPGRIPILWFGGLGTGSDPVQVAAQQAVVEDFNASQDRITLFFEIDPYSDPLVDIILYRMSRGEGPDIIGPVGVFGSNYFSGKLLDLSPLIESSDYDLSQFNPNLVEVYATPDGQISLPFAVYPSVLFFNRELFEKAGLMNPPARYGEKYRMPDGSEVEWTWDALRDIARLLTQDTSGKNALEPGFDKGRIAQYGFTWEYENHPNYWGSYWASGSMLASGGSPGSYMAQVPDAWRAAWRWTYDAIWGDQPFMGSSAVEGSRDFAEGHPFDSGKVAMTIQPYWLTCCMNDLKTWEMAAMPAYKGVVAGRIDADTFYIWKGTKHPEEAFEVLAFLVREGVQKLIIGSQEMPAAFSSLPARTANQAAWLEIQRAKFPWVNNWDIVLAGLDYPDIPRAEGYVPNFMEAWIRGSDFGERLRGTGGLDLDQEIEEYLSDLTLIFNG